MYTRGSVGSSLNFNMFVTVVSQPLVGLPSKYFSWVVCHPQTTYVINVSDT